MNDDNIPLPAQLMAPWLEDNAQFIKELASRQAMLASRYEILRQQFADRIRIARRVEPCPLGAVDAASLHIAIGDQLSVLIQAVMIDGNGATIITAPQRVSGIDGHELRLTETPLRILAESRFLATVRTPTIADLSYWSLLMEVNQAITREANIHTGCPALSQAVKELVNDGTFLRVIENDCVIPMTKSSESSTICPGISDRHIFSHVLEPGEYLMARLLVEGTKGAFGIEKRGFLDHERQRLGEWFREGLGVVFYRPHVWTRAYRIEAHIKRLVDEQWLMKLLAAVAKHTKDARMVIEPWPQFMADYTAAKTLSAVAKLYGELNWHRNPDSNYLRARTKKS
jgi:hypothetical protein